MGRADAEGSLEAKLKFVIALRSSGQGDLNLPEIQPTMLVDQPCDRT